MYNYLFQKKITMSLLWIIITVAIFFNVVSLLAQDWPIYKGNVYFTANNDDIAPFHRGILWKIQADNIVNMPIASQDVLYFTTRDGYLYAVKQSTGETIYKKKLFLRALRSLVLKEKYLIVSDFQWVYCYDKKTGEVIWARKDHDNGIYTTPTINDNIIYYGSRNNMFAKFIHNGHDLWNNANISAYDGFAYLHGSEMLYLSKNIKAKKLTLFCFNNIDGKIIWKTHLPYAIKTISPVVYQNKVYATSSSNVFLLSTDRGELLQQQAFADYITGQIAFSDSAMIFPLKNGSIVVAEVGSLKIRQTIETGFNSSPHFAVVSDEIYVIGVQKNKKNVLQLMGFSIESGKNTYQFSISLNKQDAISSSGIIIASGKIFAAAGNALYAIGKSKDKSNNNKQSPASPTTAQTKNEGDNKNNVQVSANLVDKNSGQPLTGKVSVITRDKEGNIIDKQILEINKGNKNQTLTLPKNGETEIVASKEDYFPKKITLTEEDKNKSDKPTTIDLDKIEKNKSFEIENVGFAYNKASLNVSAAGILEELKATLLKNPKIKIRVIGHTDDVGSEAYNQKLSQRRAETVKTYLVKNGIFQERIEVKGMGEKQPIASNKTEQGRTKNRRTEFVILDK